MASMDTDTATVDRRCYSCGETRPIGMFYVGMEERRARRRGTQQERMPCRICTAEKARRARKPRQDVVDAIKAASGCKDCGLRLPEHPEVFDFDHRPGEVKTFGIAQWLSQRRLTEGDLHAEVAKCDVVCANCHRIRTRSRPSPTVGQVRVQ